MNIFDQCWELVEQLPKNSIYVGYDTEGEKVPMLDNEYLWDQVPTVELPPDLAKQYTKAFQQIQYRTEFVETQAGYHSTEVSRGKHLGSSYIPAEGYEQLVPVCANWSLPVLPVSAKTRVEALQFLLSKARKFHTKELRLSVEESTWLKWYELASATL